MQSHLKLTITCTNSTIAQLLQLSTEPDNIELPKNLTINTIVNDNIYEAIIEHSGSVLTLRSTIDDLLQQMDVSLSVIEK